MEKRNRAIHFYTWRLQSFSLRADRKIRQKKINKEGGEANNATNQHNLTFLVPQANNRMPLLSEDRTFPKIHHIMGYKANKHKCKKNVMLQSVLSDHDGINLKINKDTWKMPKSLEI